VSGGVELTGMVAVTTRTATAAVLRPTTKTVDANVLPPGTVAPSAIPIRARG
jgi:hypothetical protein